MVPRNLPVVAVQPFPGFLRVPTAHHPPELFLDVFVDTYKSFPCHHMAVVVPPAAKRFVELLDQDRHWRADVSADQCSHLSFEGEDSLLCRGDVQDIAGLAIGLTEERESVFYVRDRGLFQRERETALGQELFNRRSDCLFENPAGFAGHDEVIGVANEVDTAPSGNCGADDPLQSVECHVRQGGAYDPSLRRSLVRGVQDAIFDVPRLKPLEKNFTIKGNVIQHPVPADVVITARDVRFKYPWCRKRLRKDYGVSP